MNMSDPQPRLNPMEHSPELVKKLIDLSASIAGGGQLEPLLGYLVDIRASQMNGCAFCVDMHVKEARLHGERELRLHHVAIWRESPLFSAKERAALALTEALTRIAINAWNRSNVAVRSVPGARDKMLGLDRAGLS
jgi:AhpD family alkylhydroperoxidase